MRCAFIRNLFAYISTLAIDSHPQAYRETLEASEKSIRDTCATKINALAELDAKMKAAGITDNKSVPRAPCLTWLTGAVCVLSVYVVTTLFLLPFASQVHRGDDVGHHGAGRPDLGRYLGPPRGLRKGARAPEGCACPSAFPLFYSWVVSAGDGGVPISWSEGRRVEVISKHSGHDRSGAQAKKKSCSVNPGRRVGVCDTCWVFGEPFVVLLLGLHRFEDLVDTGAAQ